jgi:hypothetical protein
MYHSYIYSPRTILLFDLTDTHARKRPRASYLPPQSARADYTNLRSRLTNRSNRSLDNTRERSLWPRSDPPNNSHETPLPFPPVPPLLVPHDLSLPSSPALSFLPLSPLPPALLFGSLRLCSHLSAFSLPLSFVSATRA